MNYSLTYNGLTITDASENYIVHKLDGLDGLDIRTSQGPLLGRDGGNIWEQRYDMRTIGIEIYVIADNVTDYYIAKKALVTAFARQEAYELLTLNFDGTNTRYVLAKPILMPMVVEDEDEAEWCDARVELKSADSFLYSQDPTGSGTSLNLYLAEIQGFDIPFDIPFDIEGGTGNMGVLANNGDVTDYPDIKIYGGNPVINPHVSNLTNGQGFTINTSVALGDYVHLYYDTEGFHVLLNDTTNYYQYFIGDFPIVELGNNSFSYTASVYDATTNVVIKFFDKLLSI